MLFLIAALVLFVTILVGAALYTAAFGGRWERRAMVAFVTAVLATPLAKVAGRDWGAIEYGVMAVDATLFVYLCCIAGLSSRFWPIWAAAAQGCAVLTHLASVVVPRFPRELYLTVQPFWAFPVLAAIIVGARSERQGQKDKRWAHNLPKASAKSRKNLSE